MFLKLLSIQRVCSIKYYQFGKWSKPPKNPIKDKEKTKGISIQDEKAGKTGKSEMEDQQKKRLQIQQLQKQKDAIGMIKEQNISFEVSKSKTQMKQLYQKRQKMLGKIQKSVAEIPLDIANDLLQKTYNQNATIPQNVLITPNEVQIRQNPTFHKKVEEVFINSDFAINSQYFQNIKKIQPTNKSRRSGVLAFKVGMTSLWDKWGTRHALTVLQIDRCQIVQIKTKENDGYTALQVGLGEKNLKNLKKPEIGHYLKNDISPKYQLQEFQVSQDCVLPIGFLLTSRHFTPGQIVDVCATSNGKGFQGVMKRWHFRGQPASHGNSLCHRAMGSTGNRQGGGSKVYKGKKMPGRMGGQRKTNQNLIIYKVDAKRNLIYVKGSVPGRAGQVVRLQDAIKGFDKNEKYLNFPTFIPNHGQVYADEMIMNPPKDDPQEQYLHDNDVIE